MSDQQNSIFLASLSGNGFYHRLIVVRAVQQRNAQAYFFEILLLCCNIFTQRFRLDPVYDTAGLDQDMGITVCFQLLERFFRIHLLYALRFQTTHDDTRCPSLADLNPRKSFSYLLVDGIYGLGTRIFVGCPEMYDKHGAFLTVFQGTEQIGFHKITLCPHGL